MSLVVKQLYFVDGISVFGSKQTIVSEEIEGAPTSARAQSIRRTPGGFLVGWHDKLHFVPDAQVRSALVEEERAEQWPQPGQGQNAAAPELALVAGTAPHKETPTEPEPPVEIGAEARPIATPDAAIPIRRKPGRPRKSPAPESIPPPPAEVKE